MNRPIRLVSGFFTVGGWTLASRVAGFVRDIMIAAFLGSGPVAQAFLIAFALPNMFRRFFAEGAFNMAFVPLFSKKLEAGQDAETFARDALSGLAALLIAFTVLAQVFMPWMVLAMASGFADDQRFDLAVLYGRIAFPYILFISITALLSGVLNALGRFAAAAAAPVLLNILFIGAMVLADLAGWDIGLALALTVPVAGVAQLAVLWIAVRRQGLSLRPRLPRLTPDLKRLAIIAAPAALAGGVVQVNLLVGRQVASFYDGAVAWLSYADRLYQLPLGVVGIAVGVVLLPDLSRKLSGGDVAGSRNAFNRAAEFSLALTVPAAAALIVVPTPLISVLFQRGAFEAQDSAATALAVAIYGAGLPAFVLQKVLQPLYFSREDTRSPFRYALVSMVVNAALAVGLMPVFGFLGAAIGTSVSGWIMALLLWRGSRGMGDAARIDGRLRRRAPAIFVSALLMSLALVHLDGYLTDLYAMPYAKFLALGALVLAGAVFYSASAILLGALKPAEFLRGLRGR